MTADGPASTPAHTLLDVAELGVTFHSEGGTVSAVRGVSYQVRTGEVLGIVGESGSGKSVSSLAVMGLLPSNARARGSVRFRDRELVGLDDRELSGIRGRRIAMIFQDPLSALTPVHTVGDQIAEAVLVHNDVSPQAALARAVELLDLAGIPNATRRAAAFPHEFSGGMRQRVMIAMAMANQPDLIIADEPTTALDVTIQAQILDVLRTAKEVTGAAVILITHDLGVVAGFADRVAVMYAGRIVEMGEVDEVFYRSRMPYTLGLLGSIPRLDLGRRQRLTPIDGHPPSLIHLPPGCPFSPRCPLRIQQCVDREPAILPIAGHAPSHLAACHRSTEIEARQMTVTDIFPAQQIQSDGGGADRETRSPVLEVRDLVKHYPVRTSGFLRRRVGTVHAVDGISFDLRERETLGLVGESGCGKTTAIMEILNLVKPQGGTIVVLGRDTATLTADERFVIRRDLQVVFQDPLASLDPRLPIGDILAEPLQTHGVAEADRAARARVVDARGSAGGAREPLPAGLLGRTAPAHRHRPRAGARAEGPGTRRARVGARRLDSSRRHQPARGTAGVAGVVVPLRRARPVGGPSSGGPGRGDVPGTVHGDRRRRRGVRAPGAPVHPGAAVGDSTPGSEEGAAAAPDRPAGRPAEPRRPAVGLPVPHTVPDVFGELTDAQRTLCIEQPPPLLARTGGPDHLDACHYARADSVL